MTPEARVRREYGGVKAALEYCISIGLGINATARQLGVDKSVIWRWRDQHGIEFPKRKDMHPDCKGANPNLAERNRKMFSGCRRVNGRVWREGEPTWHFLQQGRRS